nr:hypothetical protein [Tanacetum cinerariifolium]
VDCCPIARRSQPMSHVKPNKISPAKGDTKPPIDDKPRKNKSHLRTSTRIDSSSHLKRTISPAKGDTKLPIDDKPRKNKYHLRTSTRIDSSSRLKRSEINSHSNFVCQTCSKCVTPSNHDLCVATCLQSAMATPSIHYNHSVERKVKQVWKPKQVKQVWTPTGKVLTTIVH